jgi:hypothetical protein
MKWVTRARPKTDRIACPWLIRRFIDPDAEILYVPTDHVLDVALQEGARSFDADGAEYTHRGGRCSFEVLIDDFGLGDNPALVRLARIVHAADIDSELHTDPAGPGLLPTTTGCSKARSSSTTRSTLGAPSMSLRSRHERPPRLRRPARRHGPTGGQAHGCLQR